MKSVFKHTIQFKEKSKVAAKHEGISRHRATRRKIELASVAEIDPRTSKEPHVLNHFREQITAQGGPIQVAEEE
ncbi:MAG: hypothetical protein VW270_02420 [Candidatus Poseidoniales archaeon]